MSSLSFRLCQAAVLAWCGSVACLAGPVPAWVGSWASSQAVPTGADALSGDDLRDVTLRQTIHLTAGGEAVRIKFSNVLGSEPLRITAAHLARPLSATSGRIDPASDRTLTFSGRPDVTIPAGAEYLSDPVALPVAAFADLAVSLHVDLMASGQTSHIASHQTSFLAHGEQTAAADLVGVRSFDHWFFISGAEVAAKPDTAAIVALGDSITDGTGSTTNADNRWPDDLARRLAAAHLPRAVLNAGIGGNRVLVEGRGPAAMVRFDREVLAQPNVRYLIVLEGINDLRRFDMLPAQPASAHADHVTAIIGAYQQIVQRAHARGIAVLGATITPDLDAVYSQPTVLDRPSAAHEADRQAINQWIRTSGCFDAVVDFDAVVRDPAWPDHLAPAFDSGDHIHPLPAGYQAMADAVPLGFFSAKTTAAAKCSAAK